VEQVDEEWSCGLSIGVTSSKLTSVPGTTNALSLKQSTWLVSGEYVIKNGRKVSVVTYFFYYLFIGPIKHYNVKRVYVK